MKRNYIMAKACKLYNCAVVIVVVLICTITANAQTAYIHLGTTNDMLNGVTVTWNGQGTGDSIKWGYTPAYEKGGFAASSRSAVTFSGNWFYYNFGKGITPSATIYYRIKDAYTSTWGAQQKYHTVAAIPIDTATSDFRFAAGGDSRDGAGEFTKIANAIYAKNPDFMVFPGDLTAKGSLVSEWNTWFNSVDSLAYNKIIFPCEGNHDAKAPKTYLNMFDLPVNGNNTDYNYYSFTHGNTLFVVLNFEYGDVAPADTTLWSKQTTWMTNVFKAIDTNKIKWKVVMWHEPYYTVGGSVGDMAYAGWWPVFDKYGVDLVLNCHDHDYQRFKPINQNSSTTAPVSQYGSRTGEGRCEIITGGAGAPLDKQTVFSSPFLATFQSVNHFVIIDEKGCHNGFTQMHITAYKDDGSTIIDSVTLIKPCVSSGIASIPSMTNVLNVIPNPASNDLVVQYKSAMMGEAIIKLIDENGKVVKTYSVNKVSPYLEYTCHISGLAKGVYILSVNLGAQRDDVKVIKN